MIQERHKMKILIVGFLSLMIVFNVFSATKKTGWEQLGLNGKIKERVVVNSVSKEVYKYDANGNCIEFAIYNPDGSLDSKMILKHDDNGNYIGAINYCADGSLSGKDTSKYDDKGNCIESASYNADGFLICKEIYKYDSKGNQIENSKYKPDGSLSRQTVFKYDDKGNKIEEATYDEKGILDKVTTTSYTYYSAGHGVGLPRWEDSEPVPGSPSVASEGKQSQIKANANVQNNPGYFASTEKRNKVQNWLLCFASFIGTSVIVIAIFFFRSFVYGNSVKDKIIRFYSIPDILFYVLIIIVLCNGIGKNHGFSIEQAMLTLTYCLSYCFTVLAFFIAYNVLLRKATRTRFIVGIFYGGWAALILYATLYRIAVDRLDVLLYSMYIIFIGVFLIALGFLISKYLYKTINDNTETSPASPPPTRNTIDKSDLNPSCQKSMEILSDTKQESTQYPTDQKEIILANLAKNTRGDKSSPVFGLLRFIRGFCGFVFVWEILTLLPVLTWLQQPDAITGNMCARALPKVIALIAGGCLFFWLRDVINRLHIKKYGVPHPVLGKSKCFF